MENDISQWLIQNPQRINLGSIGFAFPDSDKKNVTETDLQQKTQTLDIWSGVLRSSFVYKGVPVSVNTAVDPDSDTVLIEVDYKLLQPRSPGGDGGLGLFFDFPFSDRNKFDAPFVGVWNATDKHTTVLQRQTSPYSAVIQHSLGQTTYFLTLKWEGGEGTVTGPAEGTHRYFLRMNSSKKKKTTATRRLRLTATFSPEPLDLDATTNASITTTMTASFTILLARTQIWWNTYWITGAFVNLSRVIRSKSSSSPTSTNITTSATELQRRILLSLYLLAVNHASSLPPQESGLVNNGWYGKFHLEMVLWNSVHFARWSHFPLFWRSLPSTYTLFLPSSVLRAREQGYKGARWGKMTDPTGRSAPGEINSLLIWQQPHPMFFAETEWRGFPNGTTLEKWDEVITATADFMASYAWFNESMGYYDSGPPMYPVSETTNPNNTINPTFELAYWRFGLDVACRWRQRQNKTIPESWTRVRDNLAPLPVVDGTGPSLDMGVLEKTAENIKRY
ncbi:Six-hairpin glycosidase-like protein [Copromyces sp. CBS 386.78]|nr:Six-hairpin glycosidase-like protein [Copromyces sp. CBS 386.78]